MKKLNFLSLYLEMLKSFLTLIPTFFKYQIVTKLILAAVIFPLFWGITGVLMELKGVQAISNANLLDFILSPQGVLFLLIGIGVCFFVVLLEIGGYIVISARGIHGKKEGAFQDLFKFNCKRFPTMAGSGSVLLLLYLVVMIPLSGVNVSAGFLSDVRIPNFITGVIESNFLYRSLYFVFLLFLTILSVLWIFSFHFIMISGDKPRRAIRKSNRLIRKNVLPFLKYFIIPAILNLVLFFLIFFLWTIILTSFIRVFNLENNVDRVIVIFLLLLQNILLSFLGFFVVPFEVHHLTKVFYLFCENTEEFKKDASICPKIPEKKADSLFDRLLQKKKSYRFLIVLTVFLTAVLFGLFFDPLIKKERKILVIGHRGGGGFSIPENSLASIEKSISLGAEFVEIDVQRTKDGAYIIQHDKNFKRMADDSRTAQEMTLSEIKKLDIGKKFPGYEGERVPSLKELLDFCKGRIGIFVELKGESADQRMVDEVIQMIKDRNMEEQTIIMALDYRLIRYVKEQYPEMAAGFTYFLAFGDLGSFESDYLILEEDAASGKALRKIHDSGKKAAVWTVNKQVSMDKFVKEEVDAIITDDVKRLKETMKKNEEKGTMTLLLDTFLNINELLGD